MPAAVELLPGERLRRQRAVNIEAPFPPSASAKAVLPMPLRPSRTKNGYPLRSRLHIAIQSFTDGMERKGFDPLRKKSL